MGQTAVYKIDGKDVPFEIRRVNFGEYQRAIQSATKSEMIGNLAKSSIDTTKMIDELMKVSVSGPVDFHLLDMQDGMDLQEKVLAYNGMGDKSSFRPERVG